MPIKERSGIVVSNKMEKTIRPPRTIHKLTKLHDIYVNIDSFNSKVKKLKNGYQKIIYIKDIMYFQRMLIKLRDTKQIQPNILKGQNI